jgi:hypothetical protein
MCIKNTKCLSFAANNFIPAVFDVTTWALFSWQNAIVALSLLFGN